MSSLELTTYRPAGLAELRDVMLLAVGDRQRLAVTGASTADGWGGRPVFDAALDTTAMAGLISYNPTDMTVAVQAGMPLAMLQDLLAEHSQWVALDPARTAAGATVGGIVATADAGPSRHTYGTSRDCVIGMTVVLADATVARSGGYVIKNVAGYDLAKLFHGSLGTLGVVAEVILRVHPRPAATATLAVPCPAGEAFALGGRLIAASLEPVALEWRGVAASESCDGTLLARFEGTAGGVDDRGRRALSLAGDAADWLPGAAADRWRVAEEIARGAPGDTVLRLGTAPDRTPSVAAEVERLAATYAVEAAMTSSMYAGVHTVRLRGGTARDHGKIVDALRRTFPAATICRWTLGLENEIAPWGQPPAAISLLRAVKRRFDPDDRLCPGRFAPWF